MNELKKLSAININKQPITVRHADLIRDNEYSLYNSECPVCKKGVLLCEREPGTFRLMAEDRCLLCSQAFVYSDIKELREREGEHPTPDFGL